MDLEIYPCTYFGSGVDESGVGDGDNKIGIEEMSITYTQQPDTCSEDSNYQRLKITTQFSCGFSHKEPSGYYFNISIPEDRYWSIEDGEDLAILVEDFKKRLNIISKKDETNTTES